MATRPRSRLRHCRSLRVRHRGGPGMGRSKGCLSERGRLLSFFGRAPVELGAPLELEARQTDYETICIWNRDLAPGALSLLIQAVGNKPFFKYGYCPGNCVPTTLALAQSVALQSFGGLGDYVARQLVNIPITSITVSHCFQSWVPGSY